MAAPQGCPQGRSLDLPGRWAEQGRGPGEDACPIGSKPGGAMRAPCGILWLAGLRPPQDYWWRQLPPPGVGLFAGLLPLVTRVAQLMVAGSLTGTSH